MMQPLKQRTYNGSVEVKSGHYLYLYSGRKLVETVKNSYEIIEAIKPRGIILHASPRQITDESFARLCNDLSDRFPWSAIGAGVGLDFWGSQYRSGAASKRDVLTTFERVTQSLSMCNLDLVVPNAESGWKDTDSDRVSKQDISDIAGDIARTFVKGCPDSVVWLSSFDQPTYHMDLAPFIKGFFDVEPECRPSGYTYQAYVSVLGSPRNALPKRFEASARSLEIVERKGILPDDLLIDIDSDVDRIPTVQVHKTHTADLVKMAVECPHIALWSAPMYPSDDGRMDEAGLLAIRVAASIRRLGFETVEKFQAANGLKPDGIAGPLTVNKALKLA
jgi:hypothetical protein